METGLDSWIKNLGGFMKEKILQMLKSIQGLQILEIENDYYWHRYEGSLADVQGWIWGAHETSRSVGAANDLQKEIQDRLEGNEDWSKHWTQDHTPKWKGDLLHLGMVIIRFRMGKQYETLDLHCTDPEIMNLKAEHMP